MTQVENFIVDSFKKGVSKTGIISLIFYKVKADDKKFTKWQATNLVEKTLLEFYLKEQREKVAR